MSHRLCKCEGEDKPKVPNFGYLNDLEKICCDDCKIPGMVNLNDIKKPKCEFCSINASYGFAHDRIKRRCVKHSKGTEMIKIVKCSKTVFCVECGITKPNYGVDGSGKAKYCAPCGKKLGIENLANMVDTRCLLYDKCKKCKPQYGFDKDKPLYCAEHGINLGMVNVVKPKCCVEKCDKGASYGKLFEACNYCKEHSIEFNAYKYPFNRPSCSVFKCNKIPCYSDSDYPKRCDLHKKDDDQNIIERPCESCNLPYILGEKEKKCLYCLSVDNPNLIKHIKVKENRIAELLTNNGYDFIRDKIVSYECIRSRPDFLLDFGYFYIVLEVDEHQHKGGNYVESCEIIRMKNIYQTLWTKTIFIRFNPDNYKLNGRIIKSYSGREEILLKMLGKFKRDSINGSMDINAGVYYLFYDGTKTVRFKHLYEQS